MQLCWAVAELDEKLDELRQDLEDLREGLYSEEDEDVYEDILKEYYIVRREFEKLSDTLFWLRAEIRKDKIAELPEISLENLE